MMDAVSYDYWWSFRKAGDPVAQISSVLDVPTVAQLQDTGTWGTQNSQGEYFGDANNGNNFNKAQSQGELPHDEVEDEYPDSEEDRANVYDDNDSDDDDFEVPGDDEIVGG